jgi:eukaryotic-like serine/threonine-protein kinase
MRETERGEDELLGRVIDDRFRILERIGAGGMAVVYRARQLSVDRDVAIKVSVHQLPEGALERVRREAMVLAGLDHPHVLKLIDFGATHDGRLYLVVELLRGRTLEKLLGDRALDPARSIHILRQVCSALIYLHARGIVHRDLTPANILVGRDDHVTLIDFGIAHVACYARITMQGMVLGTPAYLAPEQARGEAVDARADLYSLGVIAYQCLSGIKPFASTSAIECLLQQLNKTPIPLRDITALDAAYDPVLELVMELLEKNPELRPASALLVRSILDVPRPPPWRDRVSTLLKKFGNAAERALV